MLFKRKSRAKQYNFRRSRPNIVFFHMALKNVGKSARDYLIYFFTLSLGVAMFYSFNSIGAQFSVFQIQDTLSYISFTVGAMAMVSVFVCIVIGFLVVYANRFLLKRRKKEMGIYMTLGMDERDISGLLMMETFFIGIFAVAAGIPLGIILSQGLMLFSAQIMNISLDRIGFFVSRDAVFGSVVFFFLLFVVIQHFNKREIRKLKLIELLRADVQNETAGTNAFLAFVIFMLSIAFVLAGYYCLIYDPFNHLFASLGAGVAAVSVGTVLFFLSVSTIMLKILENIKGYYYKGLNMFVLRQLSSKMKSSGLSMAVISILLFLSISAMAVGPILGKSSVKGTDQSMPYDASFTDHYQTGGSQKAYESLAGKLEKKGFPLNDIFKDYSELTIYYSDELQGSTFLAAEQGQSQMNQEFEHTDLALAGIDDYNNCMRLQKKEPIILQENEFAITYNLDEYGNIYKRYEEQHQEPIKLNGYELRLKSGGVYRETLEIENVLMNYGTVIVPQHVLDNLSPNRTALNGNFRDAEHGYTMFIDSVRSRDTGIVWTTRNDAYLEVTMGNILLSYVGLYVGICFIITAGAVLALQQLSQAADNQQRFMLLEKLGTKKRMMLRAMRTQVVTYFALPLMLALVHAEVMIYHTARSITNLSWIEKFQYIALSGGIVLVLYCSYFIATYLGSKRMVMDVIHEKAGNQTEKRIA